MFFDLGAFFFLFILSIVVGKPFVPRALEVSGARKILVASITGIVVLCLMASWIVALGQTLRLLWLVIAGLATFSIVSFARTLASSRHLDVRLGFNLYLYPFLAMLISSLHNPTLFKDFLSFRNGPDLVGWVSGVQFFSQDKTIEQFKEQVTTNLNAVDFMSTLKLPGDINQSFLYKLPSFTDQVNAEFLIGAHRTGLPAFLGSVSNLIGERFTFHLIVGMQALICVLVFGLTLEFLRKKGLSTPNSVFLSSIGALNLGLLSVLLEGGMGQILLLPLLVYFLTVLFDEDSKPNEILFVILLSVVLSLSTYADFLYFFIPISSLALLTFHKHKLNLLKSFGRLLSVYIMSFLIAWPILTSLPRLAWERFFGHEGGWNMGRFPFLGDVFGFMNWLPSDSIAIFKKQTFPLSISFLLSAYILFLIARRMTPIYQITALAYGLGYVLLVILVYSKADVNNYPLFKAGAYFAVFVPFLMVGLHIYRVKSLVQVRGKTSQISSVESRLFPQDEVFTERKMRTKNYSLSSLVIFLSSAILVSSTNWTVGWFENRQQTISRQSSQLLVPILEKYDIVASGFIGAGNAKLVLLGDVRYVSPSRGFNSSVLRSSPKRDLAFFLESSICMSAKSCKIKYEGEPMNLSLLEKLDEFDVYVEK